VGEDRVTPGMVQHTVAEAADILGITTGAVRNRLSRGTLRSTKENKTVYLLLPADVSRDAERDAERDTDDAPPGVPHPAPDALTSELRDRLRYAEGQLEAERRAHAEARRLLAAAPERIPPRLQAPQEATQEAVTAEEEPEGAEPEGAEPEGAEPEGAEPERAKAHSAAGEAQAESSGPSVPAARWRRLRCTEGWQRSAAGHAKRPNASATGCDEGCTPVADSKGPTRQPRNSRAGTSPNPPRRALRRAYGGPGGGGCSVARRS
jgi:hypothetical protein